MQRRRAAQREFPSWDLVMGKSSACLPPNARVQAAGDWTGLGETEAPAGLALAPEPPAGRIVGSIPSVFLRTQVASLEGCV